MSHSFLSPTIAWSILITLSVAWILLGYFLGRHTKGLEGFALANRNVGLAFGAATAVATWITSNTTLLAPQFAIQLGVWGMIAYATASFGLFLFAPLARRIQQLMPHGFTSGDFIRIRYGWRVWIIFTVISIFYSLTWLISMGMAGGLLLETLSGIPYIIGMSVILFTCVVYTLFGGMRAVIGTDFIQSLVILIGLVIIGVVVLTRLDFNVTYDALARERPALLWVLFPASVMAVFNNLMFGIGEIFHSNVWWSRAHAIRKGLGQWSYGLAGLFWLPIPIAAGFIALNADALGVNVTAPDMVGPLITVALLGKLGAIIVFIVVFCSLASSIDSLLAATSDLITNDIYRKLLHPEAPEAQVHKAMKKIIVGLGLVAWLFCSFNQASLAQVLFFAGPLVGSCIWPIIAGLYWRRAAGSGLAMVLGSSLGLIAYFEIGWFVASLVGTIVSMVVVLISTYLNKNLFDWTELDEQPGGVHS